jgi:signal transduction histidine kinase/CheY-like chemotaxis protein
MDFFNIKTPIWQRLSFTLFILLSAAFNASASASAIPNFDLSDDIEISNLSSLHWVDTGKASTPEEAKAKLINGVLIKENFSLPLIDASHWFAFTLTNPTDHVLTPSVHIRQTYPNKVNLHYQAQSQWVSQYNGTDIALNQRQVDNLPPVFNLTLDAQESRTLYLEVHSKIKLLQLDINVGEAKNSTTLGSLHFTIVKIFIGAALIISLINALMYLSFKDRAYIYYSAFIVSFISATFVVNSFDLHFDWPLQDRSFLFLTYHSMIIFMTLFIGEVLQTKQDMPRINLILKACRWLAVAIAIMTLVDGNYFSYTIVAFIPLSALFLVILIYAQITGKYSANLLAIGVALFLSGIICVQLVSQGVIPANLVTEHSGLIGALAEMILFSLALFRRVVDLNAVNSTLLTVTQQATVNLEQTITERTKELNQAKLAAERASETRSDFFANINHEMRTPLNGILGMIEVISQQQEKIVATRHLKTLKTASQQLSSLINNVLDHSKINHNTVFEIQTIDFNILDLIDDLEDIFINIAEDKGIELSLWVPDDLSLGRQGDYMKLRQILINVMGNAIKFTKSGKVELIILQGTSEDELMFRVKDSGDGIKEDHIEHIFTAYYQAPGGEGHRQSGTGLGLAISKKLSTIMGGTLNVQSELGKGTQFDLCLPLKSVIWRYTKNTDTGQSIKSINLSGKCVLVVDDSVINQQVVEAFLSPSGITVVTANDGHQALERFKQGGIDIILMDLHMGAAGGIVATEKIRAFETDTKVEHCPIIIHTADTGAEILQQANQAGADHCLYKPYTQMQLLSVLCDFFDLEFDSEKIEVTDVTSIAPLVDKFLEHCNTSLNHCYTYIENHDFEGLGQEIHQMLGSCGVFGATSMYATLQKVERLLNEHKLEPSALLLLIATAADQLQRYHLATKQQ